MFQPKPTHNETELDQAITDALSQLGSVPAYSDEYHKIMTQIEKLYAMKTSNRLQRVSPDTLAIVLGNLVGIAIIVGHERANVVTSKALSFVMKAAR